MMPVRDVIFSSLVVVLIACYRQSLSRGSRWWRAESKGDKTKQFSRDEMISGKDMQKKKSEISSWIFS
jgi:hypothetical protein